MENQIVKHGEFDEMQRVASALAASGYFDTAKEHKIAIAQMVTKIMAGAEMGFPPFASVQGVNIIKGRPTLSANLMAAAVKGHPRYDYRIREMTDQKVVIEFFEGDESLGKSEFSKGDLERAESGSLVAPGAKKSMKERFPRNMLFARAMSNGVRWFTPDLFSGNSVYTPGEIDGNTDDGAIDTEWQVEQPKPQPEPAPQTNGTPDDVNFNGVGENPFEDDDGPSDVERAIIDSWQTPEDAYDWAVDEGHCKAKAHAQNSLRKLVNDQFGGKLTTANRDAVMLAFLRHQVEKTPETGTN